MVGNVSGHWGDTSAGKRAYNSITKISVQIPLPLLVPHAWNSSAVGVRDGRINAACWTLAKVYSGLV